MNFQQDNARIHIIRETMARFSVKGINILECSPFYPALNGMRNLAKKMVYYLWV